jgi:tetratricopeptide (TPR) repeat protein
MILVPVILAGMAAGLVWGMEDGAPGTEHPAPRISPLIWASDDATANYMIGALADVRGDVSVAAEGYMKAMAANPENMMLRHRVFEFSLMNGDVETALRLARSMPQAQQDTLTRLVVALNLVKKNKLPEAGDELRRVSKLSPELLQFQLLESYVDVARGKKLAVVEKRLLKSETGKALAPWRDYHMARMELKAGHVEQARKLLESARKAQPGSLLTTQLLGQVMAMQGDAEAAAALYAGYRQANPSVSLLVPERPAEKKGDAYTSTLNDDMAATLFDFGLLVWSEGALMPARQLMHLAVNMSPDNAIYRFYTGMLLEMGGDGPGAISMYMPLTAASMPEGVRLLAALRINEVKFRLGDEQAALNALKALLQTHEGEIALHRSIAQMAFNTKDYATAVTQYSYVADHMPKGTPDKAQAELLFARGAAYERMGDVTRAGKDLEQALVLDSTNPQILNYLGYMWIENGLRVEDAFALLRKAHILAPQDAAITDSLGWAYYLRGNYDVAQAYLLRAVEMDPASPEIVDHLGDTYSRMNRPDDAKKEWRRALDLLDRGQEPPRENFRTEVERKLRRGNLSTGFWGF